MYKTGVSGSFLGRSTWAVLQTSIFQYVRPLPFRSNPWWCTKTLTPDRWNFNVIRCFFLLFSGSVGQIWAKSTDNFHAADHFTISILHFLSDMHVDFFCNFAVRMTQASGYCLQRYACLCHHGCVGVSQAVRRKPAAKDSLCIFTKIFRVCVIWYVWTSVGVRDKCLRSVPIAHLFTANIGLDAAAGHWSV